MFVHKKYTNHLLKQNLKIPILMAVGMEPFSDKPGYQKRHFILSPASSKKVVSLFSQFFFFFKLS